MPYRLRSEGQCGKGVIEGKSRFGQLTGFVSVIGMCCSYHLL
jgi:hypothetical protein